MRTLLVFVTTTLAVTAVGADPPDPPQFPKRPAVTEPPQFPRPPQPLKSAPGWEEVPAGYPPAPKGYQWAKYPDGRWGLVQFGAAVPTAPAAPPTSPPVAANRPATLPVRQADPRPFESRPATDDTPATTVRIAAGASTRSRDTIGTGRTLTFAPGAGRVGVTSGCASG